MAKKQKQIKYVKELPNNEFCNDLKEVHDSLNSANIKWDDIIWNGKEKIFYAQLPDHTFRPVNVILANEGLPSV